MNDSVIRLREILSKATKAVTSSAARADAGYSARSIVTFCNDPGSADAVYLEAVASGQAATGIYFAALEPGAFTHIDLSLDKGVEIHAVCPSTTASLHVYEFA